MIPPRTVKHITTSREIPQSRYLKSLNRLRHSRSPVSLKKAPYSSREPQRTPINSQHNLTAPSYRHLFKMKVVPKAVRLQVAQIKQIGLFAKGISSL